MRPARVILTAIILLFRFEEFVKCSLLTVKILLHLFSLRLRHLSSDHHEAHLTVGSIMYAHPIRFNSVCRYRRLQLQGLGIAIPLVRTGIVGDGAAYVTVDSGYTASNIKFRR